MINKTAFVVAAALFAVAGSAAPSLAQSHHGRTPSQVNPYSAYGAVTPFGSPGAGGGGGRGNVSAAREKVMRDCMVEARRYSQTTWGNMESHQYRTCMAQHGQPE